MTLLPDAAHLAATLFAYALDLEAVPNVTATPIDGGWRFAPLLVSGAAHLGGIEVAVRAHDLAHAWISSGTTDDDAAALLANAPPR